MIECDKEIIRELSNCSKKITYLKRKEKFRIFMLFFNAVMWFFAYLEIIKFLNNILNNIGIIIVLLFYFFLSIQIIYGKVLDDDYKKDEEEINQLEKEVKDIEDFNDYLIAYRKLEAKKEANITIYPEIRVSDAEYVVNKLKNIYEEKRQEYEKIHISTLSLNKYYLDEKLKQAPVETYPIQEQYLLRKRQQELNKNI